MSDCQNLFVCRLLIFLSGFKSQHDSYMRNIVDLPCLPGFNNSLDGGNCLHGGHYTDDLAAKQSNVYPSIPVINSPLAKVGLVLVR